MYKDVKLSYFFNGATTVFNVNGTHTPLCIIMTHMGVTRLGASTFTVCMYHYYYERWQKYRITVSGVYATGIHSLNDPLTI